MNHQVSIALVHHPIQGRDGRIITTSVTNLDLHDLARTGRTFQLNQVFVVTPNEKQLGLVDYINNYWREGFGATYNPDRKEAFGILKPVKSLSDCCLTIKNTAGTSPLLVATTAKKLNESVTYDTVREQIQQNQRPILLCFGTGNGLAQEFLDECDQILEPIAFKSDYNHLPVRSAVAIILDRLLGRDM